MIHLVSGRILPALSLSLRFALQERPFRLVEALQTGSSDLLKHQIDRASFVLLALHLFFGLPFRA